MGEIHQQLKSRKRQQLKKILTCVASRLLAVFNACKATHGGACSSRTQSPNQGGYTMLHASTLDTLDCILPLLGQPATSIVSTRYPVTQPRVGTLCCIIPLLGQPVLSPTVPCKSSWSWGSILKPIQYLHPCKGSTRHQFTKLMAEIYWGSLQQH